MRTIISEAPLEADFREPAQMRWRASPGMGSGGAGGTGTPGDKGSLQGHDIGSDGHQPLLCVDPWGLLVFPAPPHFQAPTGGPARSLSQVPS